MKICKGRKIYILLFALLSLTGIIPAQVAVETSKEKVIISGLQYYVHMVRKGQTAYSISRAYGITIEELTKENPPALYGVKEGQSLRIPVNPVIAVKPVVPVPLKIQNKDENKYVYHTMAPGETVYSLSRSYGVSENEIIQSNPGIDINKLSVGTEIAVPRREFMIEKQKFDDQEKKFFYHKVINGETLSSIARKYGFTLRELRKMNRNVRFPQVGDYIRIPGIDIAATEPVDSVMFVTIPEVLEDPVVKYERPTGFTPVKNLKGTFDIAVLLPFYLAENSRRNESDSSKYQKVRRQNKVSRKPEEWIYPRSLDFIEMYNGILLAADTLRSLGLDINIFTYDIKNDTLGITKLIQSGKLAGMDLIIGPVYSHNLSILSRYAKEHEIPVVSPVALINNSVLIDNPTLFMASSSLEIAQKTLAKEITENYNDNLVYIHADTSGNDPDVSNLKKLIFKELGYKMPYEEIKFKEFLFYSRSAFGNDSINRISHALSDKVPNSVIIASEDPAVISEVITIVHGLSRRFDVKVFSYPSMLYISNLDPKIFFDLGMMVLSPYWIDYSARNVRQFNINYFRKFLTMPLETSYAWIGYDVTYYFLSGLAMHGKHFEEHPEIHNPALLQNYFDFERKEVSDGFENQKLFKVRYTRDYELRPED